MLSIISNWAQTLLKISHFLKLRVDDHVSVDIDETEATIGLHGSVPFVLGPHGDVLRGNDNFPVDDENPQRPPACEITPSAFCFGEPPKLKGNRSSRQERIRSNQGCTSRLPS